MKKLISVIMSIYDENLEWIISSIRSIQLQTYKNLEIIIIVDNPDISLDVRMWLEKESQIDDRLKVIYNEENIGLAMSLNKAICLSKGSYIARMDADDISELNRFELQIGFLENNNVDVVGTGRLLIDEQGRQIKSYESPITTNSLIKKILPLSCCLVHPTVIINANVLNKVGGYRNFRQSQDYDLWLRLLDVGCEFDNIDEPLLRYRVRSTSISKKRPYVQYLTSKYQKTLHKTRLKYGDDYYTEENFNSFLRKKNAFSEKQNDLYSRALKALNDGIRKIKNKKATGFLDVLYSIFMFPEMYFILLTKTKMLCYMYKNGHNKNRIL